MGFPHHTLWLLRLFRRRSLPLELALVCLGYTQRRLSLLHGGDGIELTGLEDGGDKENVGKVFVPV